MVLLLAPAVARADSYGHASPFATPLTKSTTHFVIHYADTGEGAIDAPTADEFLNRAETAYATETGALGMPAPLADNDGKTDIYVGVYTTPGGSEGRGTTVPDSTADQTTAWIALNPESFATTQVVAHEFMHVLQQSLYAHQALWIDESSAQWAAARVPGAVAAGTLLPLVYPAAPHVPLDSSATTYQQWPFFEAVAERLGDDWVRKLYERSAVLGAADHGLAAMDDVAAATGSSLAAEFDAYARRNLTGAYSFAPLAGIAAEPAFTVQTASSSAAEGDRPLDGVSTALDHLSALYVRYAGGDPCRGGETLHLSTTLPAGVPGTPAFQDRTATAAAVAPFTISGSSAAFEAPWDPCSHEGTLMLDNASTALDGQSYAVPARITYAPPDSPPGTTQRHPRLVPHFPKRFVVSRRRRVLVLKLSLDRGPAQLTLKLAPKVTKTVELRPGDHTVRLKLPRAFRAGIHRLTLVTRAPHSVPGAPRWQTVVWAVRIGFRR